MKDETVIIVMNMMSFYPTDVEPSRARGTRRASQARRTSLSGRCASGSRCRSDDRSLLHCL